MDRDFTQLAWSAEIEADLRRIVRLAVYEDLDRGQDWTTVALVPEEARAAASIVARQAGVVAGLAAIGAIFDEMEITAEIQPLAIDGQAVAAGTVLANIAGPARDLLTSERTVLNLIGRLSGIATLTRRYVEAVAGTQARIYDTRKTTPGWRRLEKYAVRCGGGCNHRTGLYDAILIKDNHLALGREVGGSAAYRPAEAIRKARAFLAAQAEDAGVPGAGVPGAERTRVPQQPWQDRASGDSLGHGEYPFAPATPAVVTPVTPAIAPATLAVISATPPQLPNPQMPNPQMIVEVEVDSLEELRQVLPERPDIILLDNMPPDMLREAVRIRDAVSSRDRGGHAPELEASGGVNLETVRSIAATGVERISVGALTHGAVSLDVALDWR